MWSSLPCFCTFCCSAIPTSCYILNAFYYLFMSFFSSLSTCLRSGLPSHSSSLSQAANDIWTIDSGISYTGSFGWRITDPSILLNTESTLLWMDDNASSPWPCLKTGGTHRSRHSKSMDNTSLNRSDIFIFMVGTYLSLSKCLVHSASSIDRPMPRYRYR